MRIKGTKELEGFLRKAATLQDVKSTVKLNGSELDKSITRNAEFIKGYQTGETKRSIRLDLQDGGFTAKVAPYTGHSAYVEYGTRFMSAQPFVRPSFNKQKTKFLSDMKRLMK